MRLYLNINLIETWNKQLNDQNSNISVHGSFGDHIANYGENLKWPLKLLQPAGVNIIIGAIPNKKQYLKPKDGDMLQIEIVIGMHFIANGKDSGNMLVTEKGDHFQITNDKVSFSNNCSI